MLLINAKKRQVECICFSHDLAVSFWWFLKSYVRIKLGTGKASPHFHDAPTRLVHPCSPAPRRDREHPVTATAIHRRRPCSVACPGAHHPPINTIAHVDRVGPDHLQPNPHRRREHAGQTPRPSSSPGKDPIVI
jgi:hypothetical protein